MIPEVPKPAVCALVETVEFTKAELARDPAAVLKRAETANVVITSAAGAPIMWLSKQHDDLVSFK